MMWVNLAELRSARQLDVLDRAPPPVNLNFNTDFQPRPLRREEPSPGIAWQLDHYFPAGPA